MTAAEFLVSLRMAIVFGSFCLVISVVSQMTSPKCSVTLMIAVGGLIVSGVCQEVFVFAGAAQNIIILMTAYETVSGCRPLHPYNAYGLLSSPLPNPVSCPSRQWHLG